MNKTVISGSFRKHYSEICDTISIFEKMGITVLSPNKSKVINKGENFAILESDVTTDMKLLESQHLEAIRSCDFLYVCNPGGYIGSSTTLEIGFAISCNKRIYCLEKPSEEIVSQFVEICLPSFVSP